MIKIGSYANYGQTKLLNVLNKIDQRKIDGTKDKDVLEQIEEIINKNET